MLRRRMWIFVNVSALFLVLACGTVAPAQTDADLEAWFRKGQGYYWGDDGLPKDARQAANWYRKAAEGGHAGAQSMLGWMSEKGEGGIPKNESQAVAWYRKAAEGGHAESQWRLGYLYEYGKGVAQDDRQAVYWYRKSAEAGDAEGRRLLGIMFEEGRGGLPQDRSRAVELLRQAADQGSSLAKKDLAELQQREAVERERRETQLAKQRQASQPARDTRTASATREEEEDDWVRHWKTLKLAGLGPAELEREAERGNATAQNDIGVKYITGEGVPQNIERGKAWLRKSAAQGNEIAKTNLAYVEERQREMERAQRSSGVKQDHSKWFGLAVVAGGMGLLFDQMDKNKARRDAYKAEQAAAYARNPSCHERCEADNQTCLAVGGDSYQCYRAKEHCKRSCN